MRKVLMISILFAVIFLFGDVLERVDEPDVIGPTEEEMIRSVEGDVIAAVSTIPSEVEYRGRMYRIERRTLAGGMHLLVTDEEGNVVGREDAVWIVLKGYFDVERRNLVTWKKIKEDLERLNKVVKEALTVEGTGEETANFLESYLMKKYEYLLSKHEILLGEGDISETKEIVKVFSDFLKCVLEMHVWREVGGEVLLKEVKEHIGRLKRVSPDEEDLERVFVFSRTFVRKLRFFRNLIYSMISKFDIESKRKAKKYLERLLENLREMRRYTVAGRTAGEYRTIALTHDILRYSLELFYLNCLKKEIEGIKSEKWEKIKEDLKNLWYVQEIERNFEKFVGYRDPDVRVYTKLFEDLFGIIEECMGIFKEPERYEEEGVRWKIDDFIERIKDRRETVSTNFLVSIEDFANELLGLEIRGSEKESGGVVEKMETSSFDTVMDISKYGFEIVLRRGINISILGYNERILKMIILSMVAEETFETTESVEEELEEYTEWFKEVVYTGADIDINSIVSDEDYQDAKIEGNEVIFEKPITDFKLETDHPEYFHWAGFPSGEDLKLVFRISSEGVVSVSAKSRDAESALFTVLFGGISNYLDRTENKPFLPEVYGGDPKNYFTSDDIVRMNFLANIAARIYFEIYDKGYVRTGPDNYPELYNKEWVLYNNTGERVTVVRSFIYHQQFDYDWYDHEYWGPVEKAINKKWSPISDNPDQNIKLGRFFEISYGDVKGSYVCIDTYTDDGMWGGVRIYGIHDAPDYSGDGEHWEIEYNESEGTYEVYNHDWGEAMVWLKGQLPTKIEMETHTVCGATRQHIAVAVIGGTINTFNHYEDPYPGDDGNPRPFVMVLKPGKNKGETFRINHPPSVPSNPNPLDKAVGVPINATLSWSCRDPDGDSLRYDIYLGMSSNPPLVKSNHTSNLFNPGTLQCNTTYYWKIVVKDGKGGIIEGPVWSFTTESSTPGEKVYVYAAGEDDGVFVIDVTNPANPRTVGHIDTDGYAYGIYAKGDYAYVADGKYFVILDISDPNNPRKISQIEAPFGKGIYVKGSHAYIACYGSGLRVIDVSDPENPREVGHLEIGAWAQDIHVQGDYAYIADDSGGLVIVDVSDPANPSKVANISGTDSHGIFVSENYAYLADGISQKLKIVDVTDPRNPRLIKEVRHSYNSAQGVYVLGDYAYVAYDGWYSGGAAGLGIIDVSDPDRAEVVGSVRTSWAKRVYVSGEYAYVADEKDGLVIVDVSNPENPQIVSKLSGMKLYEVFGKGE